MITYRDIKIRYIQSIMGFLLGDPHAHRHRYVRRLGALRVCDSPPCPAQDGDISSVAVKAVPWAFIVASIRFSCYSLTSNHGLVTKIYFPKEIFPMAAVLASLFDFFVAFRFCAIMLILIKVGWSIYVLWVPLLLATMVVFCAGIGMIVSATSLFFRDVKYIVEILLTFGIFFTPVFYDVRMFGDRGKLLLLNPVASLLDGLSTCVVRHASPNIHWYLYSLVFSLTAFLGGFLLFKHLEPAFAESI